MTDTGVDLQGGPANVRLAKFVAELPEAERSDTDALLIAYLLCQKRSTTAKEVASVIQRPQPRRRRYCGVWPTARPA